MTTKFDLGEAVWSLNTEYDTEGAWFRAKPCKSKIVNIHAWVRDGEPVVKYYLEDKPEYSRFPWEFMEDRVFKTKEDAAEFLRKEQRSYLQDAVYKARKVLDECQRKLDEFDRKHDKYKGEDNG